MSKISLLYFGIIFSVQANTFSLKKLVKEALRSSPAYKISKANLSTSQLQQKNSFSAFLPSLDIQAVQGYQNQKPINPENKWSNELRLSLNSQIYNNGTNFLNYKRSKLSLLRSKVQFEQSIAQICLDISSEYYNYSLLSEILKIEKFQLSLVRKQFRSIKDQYQQGRKTRIDFIRFKSRLQRAKLSKKRAEINKSKSIEDIKRLIAWTGKTLSIKAEPIKPLRRNIFSKPIPSLDNHYVSRIAATSKTINQIGIDLERRKYWPEISVDAGASYTNSSYLRGLNSFSNDYQTDWSALLTIEFNLWDWGIRKRNIALQKNEVSRLNSRIDNDLLTINSDLEKLVFDIDQQKDNYFLNRELVTLEKSNYKTIKGDYQRGKASFLDLVNSLNDLTSAKVSYLNSYYQTKLLLAQYFFHQGNLHEKILNN